MIAKYIDKYVSQMFALLFLGTMACKPLELPSENDLVISMEKTACMGDCPVYTLSLYSDGTAVLKGESNIDKVGTYLTRLNKQDLDLYKDLFLEYNFFDFKEKYYSNMSDLPTTYVYFSHQGKSKKVTDYDDAPEELRYLEIRLAQILSRKWSKLDASSTK